MKKGIFVLSALLTLVVSGFCLQSCSSEYDEYTTEEYGYYTEEETDAVKAMAKKYGLNIVVNQDYYGVKRDLAEIEEEMKGLAAIIGEYEIIPQKAEDGRVLCSSIKKGQQRLLTRAIEKNGEWSGTKEKDMFVVNVTISWKSKGNLLTQSVSGSASISCKDANDSHEKDSSNGSVQCGFHGNSGITFNGSVSYEKYSGDGQNESYISYSFSIIGGQVSVSPSTSGSFEVV